MSDSRRSPRKRAFGAALAAIAVVGALVVFLTARRSTPATSTLPPPTAAASSATPSSTPFGGAAVLVLPPAGAGMEMRVFDWHGSPKGQIPVTLPSAPHQPFPDQSPDGSHVVVGVQLGQTQVRAVVDHSGRVAGTLDVADQFLWSDDNAHLCLVHNPIPSAKQTSTLAWTGLGGSGRPVASLGAGDSAMSVVHSVVACSASRDLAVVQDEQLGGQSDIPTTGIRAFQISTGRLVSSQDLRATAVHAFVSPDGSTVAETTLDGSLRTSILALDGREIARFQGWHVLAFSGDASRVLLENQGTNPLAGAIEVARVSNGQVTAHITGEVIWTQWRPSAPDIALALAPAQAGAAGALIRILVADPAGGVVQVATTS